jgi:hypothetical protein
MMPSTSACRPNSWRQFSLLALFEYTTLCCILAALTKALGIGATICLMLMGLALSAGQGWLSLALLGGALLAAGVDQGFEQVAVIVCAGVVCGWYRWRASYLLHDRSALNP